MSAVATQPAPAAPSDGDGPLRHVYPWTSDDRGYRVETGERALCGHICERGGVGGPVNSARAEDCIVCIEMHKARCGR